MIYAVQGKQRNGKTLFGVNIAYSYFCRGYTIVSNVWLNFKHVRFTEDMFSSHKPWDSLKSKFKTEKIFVLLADAHLLLSAHKAKADASKMWFCTQILKILKEKGHFIYDTQNFFQMNKTLRFNTDAIFHITKTSTKGEPLVINVKVLADKINNFEEINSFDLSEEEGEIKLGLFDRWKPTEISELYV